MVIDHGLDIPQDLTVSTVCFLLSAREIDSLAVKDTSWLGVEHERYGQETLDPFYKTIFLVKCHVKGCFVSGHGIAWHLGARHSSSQPQEE